MLAGSKVVRSLDMGQAKGDADKKSSENCSNNQTAKLHSLNAISDKQKRRDINMLSANLRCLVNHDKARAVAALIEALRETGKAAMSTAGHVQGTPCGSMTWHHSPIHIYNIALRPT